MIRARKGMTQKELSELSGVALGLISEAETGLGLYLESALKIAKALETPVEAIWPELE